MLFSAPQAAQAFALSLLLALVPACGPDEKAPTSSREVASISESGSRVDAATRASRAAYVAAVQAGASSVYDVEESGGRLRARNPAQGFDAEFGPSIVVESPGMYRATLGLAGYGCEGNARPVAKALPVASNNRVEYARRGSDSADLVEWYVNGPLGLEQGFTLEQPLGCGARQVELEVEIGGTLTPGQEGDSILLRDGRDHVVARYGDLYVADAMGRELPAEFVLSGSRVRIRFDDSGATYPILVDPLLAVEEGKFQASDGAKGDEFGAAVALSGDTMIAGAPWHDHGNQAGSAYVFVRTGNVWTEQAELVPADGTPGQGFGSSVAISGDVAVIGAPIDLYDGNGLAPGSAYVFTRIGNVWTQEAKLSDGGVVGGQFGASVAVSGDTAIVGAWGQSAAYVFMSVGNTWPQQAKLLPSDGANSFGTCIGLSGDTAIIGAGYSPSAGSFSGSVYVFRQTGGIWAQEASLMASDAGPNMWFGHSCAVSGDLAAIGAPGDEDNGIFAGAAYAFSRVGNAWTQEAKLFSSNPQTNKFFGQSIALSGNLALIGDPYNDVNGMSVGGAYLYARGDDGTWAQQAQVLASDADLGDRCGWAAAIENHTAILGANSPGMGVDPGGLGAAYVFSLLFADGDPCVDSSECKSGFCVDGVCCDSACNVGPCDACSVADGASSDGTCTALTGAPCDDGNACTQTDTCQAGVCTGSNPVACAPAGLCEDTCDPATGLCLVSDKPNGTPCEDGNGCTLLDTCQSGVCAAGSPVVCTALDACHVVGVCDSTTGVCGDPEAPDGTPCTDANACTLGDTCIAGACTASSAVSCEAQDECHESGVCDPATGACNTPAKDDGTPCSVGLCQGGVCQPDQGGGGSDGATGSGGDGGAADAPLFIDGGCACESGAPQNDSPTLWLVLGALCVAATRRNRPPARSQGANENYTSPRESM